MSLISNVLKNIKSFLIKITKMKYFDESYAGMIALITLLGWKFSNMAGMSLLIGIAAIMILVLNDMKYVIPNLIYFIFSMSKGFANDTIPIPIIVVASVFVFVMLISIFRNGFHFKKLKSFYGLLGLALMNVIPIFWCTTIKPGNEVFYFLFFANIGYLVLYMIMANGIKKNSIHLLAVTMSYLGIILAFECAFKVYELKDTVDNILKLWYYLGWGLCNEAGIMICMSMPFTFYLIGSSTTIKSFFGQSLKLSILIIGLLLTTSRGAYICGFVELVVLSIALFFCAKKQRLYQNCFTVIMLSLIVLAIIFKNPIIEYAHDVITNVFQQGLDDNGRKEIWDKAFSLWKKDELSMMFGPGICSEIRPLITAGGWQEGPLVFHSTFWQTLAMGGLFGIACLIFHLIQKFYHLYKCDKMFFITIGIGFLMVDLYGMIDNTYHMYYFMIPLMVILAVIDQGKEQSSVDVEK